MKKIVLSITLAALAFTVNAQSEKYVKAMTANIAKIDSAKTADDFLSISAGFERIANAEKNQWLPYYYAAYTQVMHGFVKQETNAYDNIADKATALLDKADSLQKDNSEISCIKSLVATLHMLVNPYQRYMEYGAVVNQSLEDAKSQDPTNPRPFFLQAQNLKNTPEQFGGGCATAKPLAEQALKLYDAFKPASEIAPNWGRKRTQECVDACSK
jgi:hypothetical protein